MAQVAGIGGVVGVRHAGGRRLRRLRRLVARGVVRDLLLRVLELGDDRLQVRRLAGREQRRLDLGLDLSERLLRAALGHVGGGPDDEVAGGLALALQAGAGVRLVDRHEPRELVGLEAERRLLERRVDLALGGDERLVQRAVVDRALGDVLEALAAFERCERLVGQRLARHQDVVDLPRGGGRLVQRLVAVVVVVQVLGRDLDLALELGLDVLLEERQLELLLDVGLGQVVLLEVGLVLGLVAPVVLGDRLGDLGLQLLGGDVHVQRLGDVLHLRLGHEVGDDGLDDGRRVRARPDLGDLRALVRAVLLPRPDLHRPHLELDLVVEVVPGDVHVAHDRHVALLQRGAGGRRRPAAGSCGRRDCGQNENPECSAHANYAAISRRTSIIASSNSNPWCTLGLCDGASTARRRLSSRVATV